MASPTRRCLRFAQIHHVGCVPSAASRERSNDALRRLSIPALGLAALVATAAPPYADRATPDPAATSAANGAGVAAAGAADAIRAPFGRWLAFEWRSRGATAGSFSYSAAVRVALSVTDDFCIGDRFTVLLDAAVRGYTSDSTDALTPERPTDQGVVTRSHVE